MPQALDRTVQESIRVCMALHMSPCCAFCHKAVCVCAPALCSNA